LFDLVGGKQVIGADLGNVPAFGQRNGAVQGGGQPLVFLRLEIKAVLFLQGGNRVRAFIAAAVVNDDQFDARIRLLQHTAQAGFDIGLVVVAGADDADQGQGIGSRG